jgi:hypothetical protein
VTQGAKGAVTIGTGGIVYYVYNTQEKPVYHSSDSFTYTVTDSFGATGTGTVNVTIDIENNN